MAHEPTVGQPAPTFRARSTRGDFVDLAALRGRYVVVYFYPKAFTPGCTRESLRFRDNYGDLKALGAEVVGISLDTYVTQCEFAARHGLTFPLIADEDGSISRAYRVHRRIVPLDRRVTFVIDPEGVIAARFEHEFQVSKHLDQVLSFLKVRGAVSA